MKIAPREQRVWGKMTQEYIMDKIMQWDLKVRESEQKLVEIIQMYNENYMTDMFIQDRPGYDAKDN